LHLPSAGLAPLMFLTHSLLPMFLPYWSAWDLELRMAPAVNSQL